MNINNLNLYIDHKNYYDLYLNNNNLLNNIIQNIIANYKFEYNPEKYYRLDTKNIRTRNIYELSGLIIMLNAIIEKNFYGFCIKTGKKYKCEKMYYSKNYFSKFGFYCYHFNCNEDEFVILFGWEYFSPMYILYPRENIVYNISYRFSNINTYIKETEINYNFPCFPKDNYVSYSFGLIHNAGHHLWQEIYGLMILFEFNLLDYIDEFIIYKYDYLNISEILRNKYNKKIIYISDDVKNHNLTVNLSKHYISNNTINIFKNLYNLNLINKYNEINIMFDIRTNDRVWLNQITCISKLMIWIKHKYKNFRVNFFLSGFYSYEQKHNYGISVYNSNKEIQAQNNIYLALKRLVPFPINNLINTNLSYILKTCQSIDLCISNAGSGVGFFIQTIFNKETICFTLNKLTNDFSIQRNAFENYISNCVFLDKNNIIDNNGNFTTKEGSILQLVIGKLNNIVSQKR